MSCTNNIDLPCLAEIMNPSDEYHMRITDLGPAAVAILMIGGGMYPLITKNKDGDRVELVPLLMSGEAFEKWFSKEIGVEFGADYLSENFDSIATHLESVMIGGVQQREIMEDAITKMSPEDAKQFREKWHDERRSSMNDIGGYAAQLAEKIRQQKGAPT